jgi:hypothetical protein
VRSEGVLISFSIKYNLIWGGSVVTISSSSDGADCTILHEQKISYGKIVLSAPVSEQEVHVQGIGPVLVRWGPWVAHMAKAGRPQEVTFLHRGRQLYNAIFLRLFHAIPVIPLPFAGTNDVCNT